MRCMNGVFSCLIILMVMTIKDKKKVICILTPEFSSSSVHFKNSDI